MTASGTLLVLLAMVVELLVGWPQWLYRRVRHPVVWMGWFIGWMDKLLNTPKADDTWRRRFGVLTTLVVVTVSYLLAMAISALLPDTMLGFSLEVIFASSLIATRSLFTHVRAVLMPLQRIDLLSARVELRKIVGRQTADLATADIARGALESLAENASDGVVAPVFWGVLLGLPGLVAYKAINTLDSMIGHKTERYLCFGHFAARLDDWVNFIPARLTALLIWCAAGLPYRIKAISQQARMHRSPNAGWPESAMALALEVRLSGPRIYDTGPTEEPWLNPDGSDPSAVDLQRGLRLYSSSIGLCLVLLLILAYSGSFGQHV